MRYGRSEVPLTVDASRCLLLLLSTLLSVAAA